MNTIRADELIEEVRKHPVLYDQSTELYRHVEHKDRVWKRVAKELNVKGQEEECKKKWNGIRDSLRRARQKKYKYKYETLLEFLIPHLADRKTLSNSPDEDGDSPETGDESQQPNFSQDTQETQQSLDGGCADEPETQEPSLLPPPTILHAAPKKKPSNIEVESQESALSQLMAYILAEKKSEKTSQQSEIDPVDTFLAGIASSLKSLDPVLLIAAKGEIFNIVQEYELEQFRVHRKRGTTLAYMSSVSSDDASCVSTPLHVEGSSNPETDVIPCATTSGKDQKKRPRSPQLQETRHPKRTKYPTGQVLKTPTVASVNTTNNLERPLQQDEFDTFGQHVANQLRNLPLKNAIVCQNFINNYLAEERLKSINEGYYPNVDTTNSIFEDKNPPYRQSALTDSNSSLDPEDFLDDNSLDQNLENIVKIENTTDT